MICYRHLIATFVSLLVSSTVDCEPIEWQADISKTVALFFKDWNAGDNHQLLRDVFAPGMIRISPTSITEGNSDEQERIFEAREKMGSHTLGPSHIVSTCGNMAVVWQTAAFDKGVNAQLNGTYAVLYEHINGRAKVKLLHTTI